MSIFKSALAGGAAAELDALAARQKTEDEDALLTKRAGVETQRAIALEAYKQAAKTNRQNIALGGGSTAAIPADAATPATAGGVATPTQGSGVDIPVPGVGTVNSTNLLAVAKKFKIPEEAIRYKLADEDYKGIGELIAAAAKPNIQVTGGIARNLNALQDGEVLGGINTSSNGQTSVTVPDSAAPGGVRVVVPPGATTAVTDFANAQAGVASQNELVKRYNPETQREEYVTKAQLLKEAGGSAAPASSPVAPPAATRGGGPAPAQGAPSKFASTPREMDRVYTLNLEADKAEAELARATKAGDTDAAARAQRNIAELAQEMKSNKVPRTPGVPVADAGAPAEPVPQRRSTDGLAAGPSATAKLSNEAQGEANTNWLKNSFQPTIAAGTSADAMLASVAQSKAAMKQLGGTGWGTEAKAEAANVLTGLGLAGDRVKLYAQSAQQFQNAAMSRLQTTLNAAAGTQTNDDAKRAAETYATLKNTTGANDFILDLAQATAERDKLKANFYQNARPVAQKSGDLTEVDRIWQQKAPSVFDLPIMQRWGIKK